MRRIARRRAGMTRGQRLELRDLHRQVVMVRAGAVRMEHETGTGSGWYGRCERCSSMRWLQCAHIESVGRAKHMEYDVDNALALCVGCHLFWWHRATPAEVEQWLVRHIGDARRATLRLRAVACRPGRSDYAMTRLSLLQALKGMGAA